MHVYTLKFSYLGSRSLAVNYFLIIKIYYYAYYSFNEMLPFVDKLRFPRSELFFTFTD